MDQAQQVIIQCLISISNPATQRQGEQQLATLSTQTGFGPVLASVMASGDKEFGLRQLAGIILRQHVEKHWDPDATEYEEPPINPNDKGQIKAILPALLSDPDSKLRTAASMVIARIAGSDFPEQWPDLLTNLISAINGGDPVLATGALRCLVLFAEDITDTQLSTAIPVLFPALMRVCKSPAFPMSAKMRAVTTFRIFSSSILTLPRAEDEEGDDEEDTNARFLKLVTRLLSPVLGDWLRFILTVMSMPPVATEAFGLRIECIKALNTLQEWFPKLIGKHIGSFLKPCYTALTTAYPLYVAAVVNGGGIDQEFDDEGDPVNLPAFIFQSFELLGCLTRASRAVKQMLVPVLKSLAHVCIGYMQMTQDDVELWDDDPSEYVQFEDDFLQSLSVRVAAQKFLSDLLQTYDGAAEAVTSAASEHIAESTALRGAGQRSWWKLREAGIFAIGFVADELLENSESGFDLMGFVNAVLLPDLDKANPLPYLRARAIWCVSHFAPLFTQGGGNAQLINFTLQAVVEGLETSNAMSVRLGAARAVGMMCGMLDKAVLTPAMPKVLMLTCELMAHAEEATLHTTMETLLIALGVNGEVTASVEADVTPLLLQVWSKNTNDPLVSSGVLEVLESLCAFPACLPGLQERTLPAILSILSQAAQHSSGTIEAALDAMHVVLRACCKHRQPLHTLMLQQALPAVLAQVINTEDHSILESGCTVLTSFIRGAAAHIATATINGTPMLQIVCQALAKLLSPTLDETSASSAGGLVTQLVFKLSDQLGPTMIADILRAVVVRLHQALYPHLAESLILVFARLVHAHGAEILTFLQNLGQVKVQLKIKQQMAPTPKMPYPRITYVMQDAEVHALSFVLQKWTLAQDDVHCPYAVKVSLSALAKLLSAKDARAHHINVNGYPITEEDKSTGRRTRSRAKKDPIKHTQMAIPAKILSVLLTEYREQVKSEADKLKVAQGDRGSDEEDEGDDDAACFKKKSSNPSPFVDQDEFDDSLGQYIDLSSLLDNPDDEDLQEERYPEMADDPLNSIELLPWLRDYLRAFANDSRQELMQYAQQLNGPDQATLQQVLQLA